MPADTPGILKLSQMSDEYHYNLAVIPMDKGFKGRTPKKLSIVSRIHSTSVSPISNSLS